MLIVIAMITIGMGYALGTFNSAVYFLRWTRGIDVREKFSGTGGATNAGRIGGKKFFALTLLADALKGALAAAGGILIGGETFWGLCALGGAVGGHIFPAQLNFRGGKGLATTWGGMWLIAWQVAAVMSLIALIVKWCARRKIARGKINGYAGSIIVIAYPLVAAFFAGSDLWLLIAAIAVLLLARQIMARAKP